MSTIDVFYDLETTGIDAVLDRVCQFAAVVRHGGDEVLRYVSYANPHPRKMHPMAQQTTGITHQQLEGAPVFRDLWMDFCKQLEAALKARGVEGEGCCRFIGHNNVTFDNIMLQAELRRCHLHMRVCSFSIQTSDTLRAVRIAKKSKLMLLENAKLSTVYEKVMKKPLVNAHDALADCDAVLRIVESCGIIKRLLAFESWSSVDAILDTRLAKRGIVLDYVTKHHQVRCALCPVTYSSFFTHACKRIRK